MSKPFDEHEYCRELARIWFTLQERAKELVGAVELNHSLYYANGRVIQRIANFLVKREAQSTTSAPD